MVCLGFEPGRQDGRRRRNHGAMVATPDAHFRQLFPCVQNNRLSLLRSVQHLQRLYFLTIAFIFSTSFFRTEIELCAAQKQMTQGNENIVLHYCYGEGSSTLLPILGQDYIIAMVKVGLHYCYDIGRTTLLLECKQYYIITNFRVGLHYCYDIGRTTLLLQCKYNYIITNLRVGLHYCYGEGRITLLL